MAGTSAVTRSSSTGSLRRANSREQLQPLATRPLPSAAPDPLAVDSASPGLLRVVTFLAPQKPQNPKTTLTLRSLLFFWKKSEVSKRGWRTEGVAEGNPSHNLNSGPFCCPIFDFPLLLYEVGGDNFLLYFGRSWSKFSGRRVRNPLF